MSETQLTSRGNKIDQRKQGKIGSREEIGSQSKQLDVDNNIQKKNNKILKKEEPVENGSWPLIDSHLLSGYNLCWNHFEKLYLDLILHIVKPYIWEVGWEFWRWPMSLRALSCQKEEKEEGADKRYREVMDINEEEGEVVWWTY